MGEQTMLTTPFCMKPRKEKKRALCRQYELPIDDEPTRVVTHDRVFSAARWLLGTVCSTADTDDTDGGAGKPDGYSYANDGVEDAAKDTREFGGFLQTNEFRESPTKEAGGRDVSQKISGRSNTGLRCCTERRREPQVHRAQRWRLQRGQRWEEK